MLTQCVFEDAVGERGTSANYEKMSLHAFKAWVYSMFPGKEVPRTVEPYELRS